MIIIYLIGAVILGMLIKTLISDIIVYKRTGSRFYLDEAKTDLVTLIAGIVGYYLLYRAFMWVGKLFGG